MKQDSDGDPPREGEKRPIWNVFFDDPQTRRLERHVENRLAGPVTLWLIALALAAVLGLAAIDRAGLTPDWISERCQARGGLRC